MIKTNFLLIVLMIWVCAVKAQTVEKFEGNSPAATLKFTPKEVVKDDVITKKDADVTGPVLSVAKPADYEVFYINFAEGAKGLKATVKVEFEGTANDGSGVISIVINGTSATFTETTTNNYKYNLTVNLPVGENVVEIKALDKNNNSSTVKRNITVKPNEVSIDVSLKKRNLYVLSIGISNFQNSGTSFSNLTYAHSDAKAIETIFKAQEGIIYNKVFTKTLVNDKATRTDILDGLTWLEDSPSQGDVVVLFISSHGFSEAGFTYIMPYDGKADKLRATAIDFDDIDRTLKILSDPLQRNCRILTLLDACHSGGIGVAGAKGASALSIETALKTLERKEAGVLGIYSSAESEISYENSTWLHGAFTYSIIKSLQNGEGDANNDQVISFDELGNYIKENVKTLTSNKQHPVVKNSATITEFPVTVILK